MENIVEHTYAREYIEKLLIQKAVKFDENHFLPGGTGLRKKKLSAVFNYDQDGEFTAVEIVSAPKKPLPPEQPLKWIDKCGRVWSIPDMETSHLKNVLAFLRKHYLNRNGLPIPLEKIHWALAYEGAITKELDSRE